MRYFPLPIMLIAVICGLLVSRNIIVSTSTALIILLCFVAFIVLISVLLRKLYFRFSFLNVLVVFFCVLAGMALRISNNTIFHQYETQEFADGTLLKVISSPKLKGNNYRFKGKIIGEKAVPDAFVYIRNKDITTLPKRADVIQLDRKMQLIENGNFNAFDFKAYCHRNNIAYSTFSYNSNVSFVDTTNFSGILFFEKIQERLSDKLLYYLQDSVCYSIAAALILGNDQLTQETRAVFSATGSIHVLCVSGMHVSIIFLMITFLFKPFTNIYFRRIVSPLISLILLWIYAAITGFSPSVTRSAFMLSFVLVGIFFDRDTITLNTLCGAAVIMIVANCNILYNIGFQLSYCAVLGILFFNNEVGYRLQSIYPSSKKLRAIPRYIFTKTIELVSVSLSVQLFLAPILLHYFKVFPNYFLLANIVAIPLATVILYVGVFFVIISPVEFLAAIVSKVLYVLIKALVSCTKFIYNLPLSTFEVSSFNIGQVLLFIVFAFLMMHSLKSGFSMKKIVGCFTIAIVFVLCSALQ